MSTYADYLAYDRDAEDLESLLRSKAPRIEWRVLRYGERASAIKEPLVDLEIQARVRLNDHAYAVRHHLTLLEYRYGLPARPDAIDYIIRYIARLFIDVLLAKESR